ncbi:MAG TPA: hypothetical protein VF800_30560 [Telluria sp.]|jgi:hypothetical protein
MNEQNVLEGANPPVSSTSDTRVSNATSPRQHSHEVKRRVLDLRRTHSLRQVAELAGLPLGTVKTICSRSGSFRDNLHHRSLFTLPPMKVSLNTGVSVPELPPQQVVTGDKEIDAVLWLREVIGTGQASLIEKAMQAAARLKSPLEEIEKRYSAYLHRTFPGNFGAVFASFGFADLAKLGERAVEKAALRREARARFGDSIYVETPAEQFCMDVMRGVDRGEHDWKLDLKQVVSAFEQHPHLLPHTLSDCLHELGYWYSLSSLRYAFDTGCDPAIEVQARDDFLFLRLSTIRARNPAEAVAVFRHLANKGRMDRIGGDEILLNLIGGPANTRPEGGTHAT